MAQEKFTLTTTTKLCLGSLQASQAIKNNNSAIAGFEHGTYKSQDPLIQLRSIGQAIVVGLICPASPGLKLDVCISQKLVPTSLYVPVPLVYLCTLGQAPLSSCKGIVE